MVEFRSSDYKQYPTTKREGSDLASFRNYSKLFVNQDQKPFQSSLADYVINLEIIPIHTILIHKFNLFLNFMSNLI